MTYYCLGIRLDENYNELTCEDREHCLYYTSVRLSEAFSRPDEYKELETYNNNKCTYFNEQWKQLTTCATSVSQTDGPMTLLSYALSK